ncbi:MAG: AI-2E family transporter [Candidatus Acidiferrales bacterium]
METQTPIVSVANATFRLPNSASARIIAAGIVIAFLHFASSVVVTLLVAVLLAYFLDPIVTWLEDWHIPRALGAFLIVMAVIGGMFAIGWVLVSKIDSFSADWPKFREPLHAATAAVQKRLEGIEAHVSEIAPSETGPKILQVTESHPFRNAVVSRLSGLYEVVLGATFIPFLLFFMLAAKRQVWHATMQLFPSGQRTQVKQTLTDVSAVLRSYVIGTSMVAITLVITSWLFFWAIGLDYAFLTGLVAGLLNLVPYLGVVMSFVPPTLIGLKHFHTVGPFLGIYAMLMFLHLITANLLFPAMVGRRVHLNALAVTVALLFWGWIWGGAGLILAIPITATIKVLCDNIENLQPVGRWLGA